MKLNLGAADTAIPGYLSVDRMTPCDIQTDLSLIPWPWPDSSIEAIIAHDILEHLPNRIDSMNELHRVLIPHGLADIIVPSASHGAGFAQDPTHKSAWCMNSFQYYEAGSFAVGRLAERYCIRARFRIVEISEDKYMDAYEEVWKVHAVLEAVK